MFKKAMLKAEALLAGARTFYTDGKVPDEHWKSLLGEFQKHSHDSDSVAAKHAYEHLLDDYTTTPKLTTKASKNKAVKTAVQRFEEYLEKFGTPAKPQRVKRVRRAASSETTKEPVNTAKAGAIRPRTFWADVVAVVIGVPFIIIAMVLMAPPAQGLQFFVSWFILIVGCALALVVRHCITHPRVRVDGSNTPAKEA